MIKLQKEIRFFSSVYFNELAQDRELLAIVIPIVLFKIEVQKREANLSKNFSNVTNGG